MLRWYGSTLSTEQRHLSNGIARGLTGLLYIGKSGENEHWRVRKGPHRRMLVATVDAKDSHCMLV